MGMIKVPVKALQKFQRHYLDIFKTGNLAEGKWNTELSNYYKKYVGAFNAIPFASNGSALIAILMLLILIQMIWMQVITLHLYWLTLKAFLHK